MKKRIIAGVAALIMSAAVMPMNEIAGFVPTMNFGVITASAANEYTDVDGLVYSIDDTVDRDGNPVNWQIRIFTKFEDTTSSSYTIGVTDDQMSVIASHIEKGTLSDYKIVYSGNYGGEHFRTFPSVSKITISNCAFDTIGDSAFSGCQKLTTIELSDNIKYIGNSAFGSCPLLIGGASNQLDLKNVQEIGNGAFQGAQFTTIKFSDKTTKIGASAFQGCTKLKNVVLPSSLRFIYSMAFSGCSSLETVLFGKDPVVEFIGGSAFSGCTQLTKITVDGAGDENTIPADTLEVYGTNMFENCTSLQSFCWPSESRHLPSATFRGCKMLNKVYFGDKDGNSQVRHIGSAAFQNCTGLTELVLPESTVSILNNAFNGCTNLKTLVVSDDLKYISGHEEYKAVEGYDDGRSYLTIVQRLNDNKTSCLDMHRHMDGSTFQGCTQLSIYPRSKMGGSTSSYTNKVILPDSVIAIPDSCFLGCSGITDVTIGDVESIGIAAFRDCKSLKSVKIPDYTKSTMESNGYTYINDSTFSGCDSLKDVEIPDNLRLIYGNAFYGCKSLETMTPASKSKMNKTVQIPDLTTGISTSAFFNCSAFEYLNFGKDSELGALSANAFNGCSSLIGSNTGSTSANNTIAMPTGIKVIEDSVFANCTSLDKITFLGEVSTVGANAFANCSNLEQVIMNDTIETVDKGAFSKCTSLKQMPQTLDGKPALINLKVINQNTFEGCTSLESAFISKNITQINSSAFAQCSSLKNVQWETGSTLKGIGNSAFLNCSSLELFSSKTSGTASELPSSLENIDVNAFSGSGLVDVKLYKPDSGELLFVGDNTFANCKSLVKLDMSESNINSIPKGICANCAELKTVVLPKGTVTAINDAAFSACSKLHTFGEKGAASGEYVLPEGLNKIGANAFANNFSMQKITIPSTVSQIDVSMFNLRLTQKQIEDNGYTPIEYIQVNKDNENYSSKDGILYNKDQSTLLVYPCNKKDTKFTVPDTVQTIGSGAMSGNVFLTDIKLDAALQRISTGAFSNETNLKSVDFGKNASVAIENNAFSGHRERVTLYGSAGSTAERYAAANVSVVTFVDNEKAAATIKLLDEAGAAITESTFKISKQKGRYKFGVEQKDKNGAVSTDTLKWSIDRNDIATINNDGTLSMSGAGTITLTVQNAAGNAVKTLKIQIVDGQVIDTSAKVGDVNGDGKIDIGDVSTLMNHINGVKALDAAGMIRADVDKSSTVDIKDASTIMNHINGVKALY